MATGTERVRVQYADSLTTHDKCRAILKAGADAGLWRVMGLHEGHYVIIRDGEPQVLAPEEVLDLPVDIFLDANGP